MHLVSSQGASALRFELTPSHFSRCCEVDDDDSDDRSLHACMHAGKEKRRTGPLSCVVQPGKWMESRGSADCRVGRFAFSRLSGFARAARCVWGVKGHPCSFAFLSHRVGSLFSRKDSRRRDVPALAGARDASRTRGFVFLFWAPPGRPETDDDAVGRVAAECASFGSLCWGFSVLSLPLSLQCRLSSLITDAGRVAAEVHWALAACARMLLHLRACCCVG